MTDKITVIKPEENTPFKQAMKDSKPRKAPEWWKDGLRQSPGWTEIWENGEYVGCFPDKINRANETDPID